MTGPSTFSLRPKPIVSDAENEGLSTTKQVFVEYKKVLAKGKNSSFRIKGGPQFGAYKGDFTYGGEISFEYNIQLENGVQVSLIQKNQVNFNHGDDFRNGILVAFKIPF